MRNRKSVHWRAWVAALICVVSSSGAAGAASKLDVEISAAVNSAIPDRYKVSVSVGITNPFERAICVPASQLGADQVIQVLFVADDAGAPLEFFQASANGPGGDLRYVVISPRETHVETYYPKDLFAGFDPRRHYSVRFQAMALFCDVLDRKPLEDATIEERENGPDFLQLESKEIRF